MHALTPFAFRTKIRTRVGPPPKEKTFRAIASRFANSEIGIIRRLVVYYLFDKISSVKNEIKIFYDLFIGFFLIESTSL